MSENLADRLDAVERALTDGDADLTEVRERAALSGDVDRLETRVEELEAQVEELDAALEAVRGYAGNVRAVNREVERRASAALAKAEALETAVDGPVDDTAVANAQDSVDAGASDEKGDALGGGTDRPGSGSGSPAGRFSGPTGASTTDPAGRDEFDWGLDETRDTAGRESESTRPGGNAVVGRDTQHRGTGDQSNRRSRPRTARKRGDAVDHEDDEGSGTEQFIERVRDAL